MPPADEPRARRRAHVSRGALDSVGVGETFALPDDVAHRFAHVLRLKGDAQVELFDGSGLVVKGRFCPPGSLLIDDVTMQGDALPPLVVVQAVIKTEKLEWVVQKSVECGAAEVIFFEASRGQVRWRDRAQDRVERLSRIAADAARQAGRACVPQVRGPLSFAQVVAEIRGAPGVSTVGVLGAHQPLAEVLRSDPRFVHDGMHVVIGPEGGLEAGEVASLIEAGATGVALGVHVLRTETAALVALAAAQTVVGTL